MRKKKLPYEEAERKLLVTLEYRRQCEQKHKRLSEEFHFAKLELEEAKLLYDRAFEIFMNAEKEEVKEK